MPTRRISKVSPELDEREYVISLNSRGLFIQKRKIRVDGDHPLTAVFIGHEDLDEFCDAVAELRAIRTGPKPRLGQSVSTGGAGPQGEEHA